MFCKNINISKSGLSGSTSEKDAWAIFFIIAFCEIDWIDGILVSAESWLWAEIEIFCQDWIYGQKSNE